MEKRKNITAKLKTLNFKLSAPNVSFILEQTKRHHWIIFLNVIIIILLFFLSPYLGVVGLLISIILLFIIPPSKTKKITHR